jgi:hypothetical protein
MSEPILILGSSGSGKSRSLKSLDPKTTLLISVDGKRPPFSMKEWGRLTKENPEGSFTIPNRDDPYKYVKGSILQGAKTGKKTFVIDDSQFLMANEFFDRAKETGYNKFTELGQKFWDLIEFCRDQADDATIYFLHHLEYDQNNKIKPKTIGKMLDEKGSIEGRFSVCLLCEEEDGKHFFRTKVHNQSIIKAPEGMFEGEKIENDLSMVEKSVREFWGME